MVPVNLSRTLLLLLKIVHSDDHGCHAAADSGPRLKQEHGQACRRRSIERNTWQDYGDRLLAEYSRRLHDQALVKPAMPGTIESK